MYPNLYYAFKDWFGVEWKLLSVLNTFGLMVALAFVSAAIVLNLEFKRKEKQGLLHPREEIITVGLPASLSDLIINGLVGFIFGYKIFGLIFNKPEDLSAQQYILSTEGNFLGGLVLAAILAGMKWREKNKQKLKVPEKRTVRIWPHDRVGDIIILGLIFGILGAKVFDNLENWDEFIKDPIGNLFAPAGLTFYGGLIFATIAICWYSAKKGINLKHLVDVAAPALMIAYAIGRIGCQISGDGDWGIYNSAYTSNEYGKISLAAPGDFQNKLQQNASYFIQGKVNDSVGSSVYITDRYYESLDKVPNKSFKGSSILPGWFFAYSYPQNVNKDGILIPGNNAEYNRVLPAPVYPTPLYETIICILLFMVLWVLRTRISTPMVLFGIYLILNGTERFFIEKIRVNHTYNIFGFQPSQAELISSLLIITGLALIIVAKSKAAN